MDNVTHTLAGALLAECGLKRRASLAYPALLIGANLPDVDVASYLFGGGAAALSFRRGWTHGVLAMVVLPFALAVTLVWWEWMRRARADKYALADRRRSSFGALVAVSAIGIVSHPLLDLLNNYGVRLLMPFSGRWFYGDAAFIVDPWMLVLMIGGIWLSRRDRGYPRRDHPGPARVAFVLLLAYIGGMVWISATSAAALASAAGVKAPYGARTLMVTPEPIRITTRSGLVDTGNGYEAWRIDWSPWGARAARSGAGTTTTTSMTSITSKGLDDQRVVAAFNSEAGRRFRRWARFPYGIAGVDGDAALVHMGDARYTSGVAPTWATTRVRVPPTPGASR